VSWVVFWITILEKNAVTRRRKPGIFCFEGDWSPDLRTRTSVRRLLEFLSQEERIDFIYRDIGTPEELTYYVNRWRLRSYAAFNIGYFAFHGEPDAIFIGKNRLNLVDIGEMLNGACAGKVVYFGSCSTLGASPNDVRRFKRMTKAKCVCGYTKDVEWLQSASFELLLFDALTYYQRIDAVENYLRRFEALKRQLGFKMYR